MIGKRFNHGRPSGRVHASTTRLLGTRHRVRAASGDGKHVVLKAIKKDGSHNCSMFLASELDSVKKEYDAALRVGKFTEVLEPEYYDTYEEATKAGNAWTRQRRAAHAFARPAGRRVRAGILTGNKPVDVPEWDRRQRWAKDVGFKSDVDSFNGAEIYTRPVKIECYPFDLNVKITLCVRESYILIEVWNKDFSGREAFFHSFNDIDDVYDEVDAGDVYNLNQKFNRALGDAQQVVHRLEDLGRSMEQFTHE